MRHLHMCSVASVLFVLAGTACAQDAATDTPPATTDARIYGLASPKPKPEGTIRLATYNLFNLFDDHDDPSMTERNEDIDDATPADQKQALAETIRTLDADILAVEEIENRSALIEFRETYLKDMGYNYVVSIDTGDDRGIENAVLSRFPITHAQVWPNLPLGGTHPEKYGNDANWYAGQPIAFKRSPLRADVSIDRDNDGSSDYQITLFVVHHKSGTHNTYWREAEAKKVVQLIDEVQKQNKGANVAVLGDFNARAVDMSVATYIAGGLLDPFAGRVPHDPEIQTHESNRRIDFILVNPALANEYVPNSIFVLGTPSRPKGADWRTTPAPPGWASDHYPVAIDLVPQDR